jgi:cysteine desulfurase
MFWRNRMYLDTAAGVSGNASSPHTEGRAAKARLEAAREKIARLLEVKADDVVFTGNATEANALSMLGYVRALRKRGRGHVHVLYLPSAHASIVENVRLLEEEGAQIEPLPIAHGRVDTDKLATMLTKDTVLVSMEAVCGETGVVWNTREVADVMQKWIHGSAEYTTGSVRPMLHVDASQAPQTQKVARSHFGADLLSFDISKIAPERGLGVLVARRTIPIDPLYAGGGQERGLRPGSESPELAEVFAESLQHAVETRERFVSVAGTAREAFKKAIREQVPDVLFNEGPEQAPQILNMSFVGHDTDYIVALLDEAGFATSTRSACETDSEQGSRAVFALTQDVDRAKSTLRLSWGTNLGAREIDRFARALKKSLPLA